ncbi:hypothetical protein Y032_0003g1267 [Ancylostoma ceylanicum]|uniref:Uncharacterized protein n=1 Tax=Ancylostoma ceylanicum TaxID=53326 RepID=A0A016VW56_9BILA|nr:hypothetical protein Y032_0003g1267 [Ancylostoma ceylanicum]
MDIQFGDDERLKFECFKRLCRQPGIPYKVGYLNRTFFETLRGDRKKIFLVSYLFAYDLGLVKEMARTLEIDEKSISSGRSGSAMYLSTTTLRT